MASTGYQTSIPASPGCGYATTQVRYAPDSLSAADQVAARIPGGATLVPDVGLTPTAYNLEVVTGSTYIRGPAMSGAANQSRTSASTATASTTPGTNSPLYRLPGTPAGQVPSPDC